MENTKEKVIYLAQLHNTRAISVKEEKKELDGRNSATKTNTRVNISITNLMVKDKSKHINIFIKDYSNLEDLMVMGFKEQNSTNIWDSLLMELRKVKEK